MFAAASALALLALCAGGARAQAAENVYWNNYKADPETIAFADVSGLGGGALNLGAVPVESPEGMAYDSVTNRFFVVASGNAGKGQIIAINLDGSGASVFAPAGAPVAHPYGLTLDPATRMIYWINTENGASSIAQARLDGSGGGVLNSSGVELESAYRLAIDPVAGRLYFGAEVGKDLQMQYVNVNGTGGGTLNIAGATPPESISGVAADPAGGRVFWVDNSDNHVSYARTDNSGGGDVALGGAPIEDPFGLAYDPGLGKVIWANYDNNTKRDNALGFALLTGGGGGITIATAPLNGPQDPVILKSPQAVTTPTVAKSHNQLSCSQGTWGADAPGGFVYQAPRSYAYQWTNNGAAIAGATSSTLTATAPGSYACTVTAANQTGTAAQSSAATTVAAPKVALTTKKRARVKPGGFATFSIQAVNQGDLAAAKAEVCTTVPKSKKARKSLKAPKCKPLQPLAGAGVATAAVKIKVKPKAKSGTYNVTFKVSGSAGLTTKAKLIVKAPKKHKK